MIRFLKIYYEKILVGLAAAALALSLGWTGAQHPKTGGTDGSSDARVTQAASFYVPSDWRVSSFAPATWSGPVEQSAGNGWVYELFAPPTIYYDATTRSFVVTPADYSGPGRKGGPNHDTNADRPELFRLQLAGYFGSPGDYLLAFVSPGSPDTHWVRVGARFEELALTLKSFEVKKVPVENGDPWPVYDVAGFATLLDERTGGEVVLDTRTRKLGGDVMASRPGIPPTEEATRIPELSAPVTRGVANNGP